MNGHNLSLQDKQVIGATYSNQLQRETTQNALQATFNELVSQCIKPTQKAVSLSSGKSLKTVKRYWSKLEK
ncbi:Putative replicase RepA [Moritella viscosa]|uniref:Replicase RepA n=1 Tax=Moritella viscosa TaxID=80854 RepID=A0ABY1HLL2_9GAMM|nr:Putative replicase RepA [Moritella viscosa]